MKHRMQLFLLPILCSTIICSACANLEDLSEFHLGDHVTHKEEYSVHVYDMDGADTRVIQETHHAEEMHMTEEEEGTLEESVPFLSCEPDADTLVINLGGDYAYRQITEEEQLLYNAILDILMKARKDVQVPSKDPNKIDFVFNCVMLDHPELFYVNGYTYTKYTVKDHIQSIDFSGSYTMDESQIREKQSQVVEVCNQILAEMSEESDYQKVKYLYERIITHTEYEQNAQDNQNILSVLLYGKSVCQGYAKTMQYLTLALGMDSFLITGTVNQGEGHAWNLIRIEDAYYQVDVTWGDASYSSNEEQQDVIVPDINYDYLCVSTPLIQRSHKISSIVDIPYCSQMDYNYYVQEGAYFITIDEEQLSRLFERGYAEEQQFVTIKCSTDIVYADMEQYLLDQTHIFEYIQGNPDQIVYSMNQLQTSMSFWLYHSN